jgi:DNA-binding response OmpR family regulator
MEILLVCADDARAALLACHARTLWPAARIARAPGGTPPNLTILDLAAPGGLATCRRLSAAYPYAPLLALGGGADAADEVPALDVGAAGYQPRDAHPRRLLAHLRALGRRATAAPARTAAGAVEAGLVLDAARREARLDGVPLALTPTEYALLAALAADRGQIVSHRTLLERAWGVAHAGSHNDLKAYIHRLRVKLDDGRTRPSTIQSCRGQGYRLSVEAA